MKVKSRGRTLDVHPLMVRQGRMWDPVRQAYYPSAGLQGVVSVVTGGALGWFGMTLIEPWWLAMTVIVLGASVLGIGTSKVRWWIWKRRHPELPPDRWVEVELRRRANEQREAARWN